MADPKGAFDGLYNGVPKSNAWWAGYMSYGDIGFTTDQDYADYREGFHTKRGELSSKADHEGQDDF